MNIANLTQNRHQIKKAAEAEDILNSAFINEIKSVAYQNEYTQKRRLKTIRVWAKLIKLIHQNVQE